MPERASLFTRIAQGIYMVSLKSVSKHLVVACVLFALPQMGAAQGLAKTSLDISGFKLGMTDRAVTDLVNSKLTNSDYSEPQTFYSLSRAKPDDFAAKTYLSKVTLKYKIYEIDVYLNETGTGPQVNEVSLHFQGNQLPLGYGEMTDNVSVANVKTFSNAALARYNKPTINNSGFFTNKSWYGPCVLHNSQNYRSDVCNLALYYWCATGVDPNNMHLCAVGDFLGLSRSGSELRLVRPTLPTPPVAENVAPPF